MILDFSAFTLKHTQAGTFYGNNNCRMAAYFAQNGRCYVTGKPLLPGQRELHHRLPRYYGGEDTPENLILLDKRIHSLVHCGDIFILTDSLQKTPLSALELKLLNQLRKEAMQRPI
jgi:hypothetical protein